MSKLQKIILVGLAVVGIIIVGFFLLNNYIYKEKQGTTIDTSNWKTYSSPFISFRYPSRYVLEENTNAVTDGATDITVNLADSILEIYSEPNDGNLGEDDLFEVEQNFLEERRQTEEDTFRYIQVAGKNAAFEKHLASFDANAETGKGAGVNWVQFYTKDFVYYIDLTWWSAEDNNLDAMLQKEYRAMLDSFVIKQ